jgi:hypothetical protein
MRPSTEEMISVVLSWFEEASEHNRKEFKESSEIGLISWHNSLGRNIRNYFELWNFPWEPVMFNGIDVSKDHPDALSMEVIRKVWKEINK